jgi:hypothetical protein
MSEQESRTDRAIFNRFQRTHEETRQSASAVQKSLFSAPLTAVRV